MFDFLKSNPAVSLLKADHDKVKELFDAFENAEKSEKLEIARQACLELKVHTAIEEEIFYPAVRTAIGKEIMNEADEEHHIAKVLIAELESMDGSESHFDGKFTVLAESVRHHIKEEEDEMLPEARKLEIDFESLAQRMLQRQRQLKRSGTPPVGEEMMVTASGGEGDSSAKAAKHTRK